ncbi:MAG TPA: ABC transporter permease [Pseudobdellovibrionaceae bacterium]|nr:ABC transporter permease [Pseudobdellovibrionaceae bacterium]
MLELILNAFIGPFTPPYRRKEFFQQLYFVGNQSLYIIVFCVVFAAVVTILESSFHMKLVIQNDSMVPGFATLLILRELGSVVTALLLTSRIGAGYASEIATMQITEQNDALKMLGIDPIHFLLVPRFLASVVGAVLLTAIANVVCVFAAMLISDVYLGYSPATFVSFAQRFVGFQDFYLALVKAACFGAIIPIVACYFGFRSQTGADGVGRATTNTVVVAAVSIIVVDFILSFIFSYLY